MSAKQIAIAGGPNTGKTTLARQWTDRVIRSTDTLVDLCAWSEQSEAVSHWFDAPGSWVIEGCTVVRALRKWLRRNPTGKPCDKVIFLTRPYKAWTRSQGVMASSDWARWLELKPMLVERGVLIDGL